MSETDQKPLTPDEVLDEMRGLCRLQSERLDQFQQKSAKLAVPLNLTGEVKCLADLLAKLHKIEMGFGLTPTDPATLTKKPLTDEMIHKLVTTEGKVDLGDWP